MPPMAGCSPTFIWVRHTKVRPATCTGESPHWSLTMCSGRSRPTPRSHAYRHHHDALSATHAAGALHAEARITRTDGVKAYAAGHLADDEGVTVEAEGIFIQPKWARG